MKCEHCGQAIPETASAHFERFWQVWPNKVKRKKAMATWKRRKLDNRADMIIADVMNRMDADPRWQAGYIPDPTTYINGDRWEDEINTIAQPVKWPVKNEGWLVLGQKHRINPGAGEGWPKFKDRVRRAAEAGQ